MDLDVCYSRKLLNLIIHSFHGLSIANVPCITSGISRWAISSISDQFYSFTQRSKSLQQIEWQWTVMSKCPGWQHHWDYENVHKNSGRIIGQNDVAMSTSLSISMTTQKLNYLHLKSYRERLGIKLRFTIYWGLYESSNYKLEQWYFSLETSDWTHIRLAYFFQFPWWK